MWLFDRANNRTTVKSDKWVRKNKSRGFSVENIRNYDYFELKHLRYYYRIIPEALSVDRCGQDRRFTFAIYRSFSSASWAESIEVNTLWPYFDQRWSETIEPAHDLDEMATQSVRYTCPLDHNSHRAVLRELRSTSGMRRLNFLRGGVALCISQFSPIFLRGGEGLVSHNNDVLLFRGS